MIVLCLVTPLVASSSTLSDVEFSTGLDVPCLDTGNTELEFGDENAGVYLDIVSIGDHGSPHINTPGHGIMVGFGDGAGEWSVCQQGDLGYGAGAVGDANGGGDMDVGDGMHYTSAPTGVGDQILEVAHGDGSGLDWTAWDDGLATNGGTWGMFKNDFADVDNDGDPAPGSPFFGCCVGVHVYLAQADCTWRQSYGLLGGNASCAFTFGEVNVDAYPGFASKAGIVNLGAGAGGGSGWCA